MELASPKHWMVLPPGTIAICRFPVALALEDIVHQAAQRDDGFLVRVATAAELVTANRGFKFPWGNYPDASNASRLWKEKRVGIGGLVHTAWFITSEGRVGGAPNVPDTGVAALRYNMYLDGGSCAQVADNEGYALARKTNEQTAIMYRKVQMYGARHVGADGGAIIVSPINADGTVYTGFVGRCQFCPNPELISIEALREGVLGYRFVLWDEWKDWRV